MNACILYIHVCICPMAQSLVQVPWVLCRLKLLHKICCYFSGLNTLRELTATFLRSSVVQIHKDAQRDEKTHTNTHSQTYTLKDASVQCHSWNKRKKRILNSMLCKINTIIFLFLGRVLCFSSLPTNENRNAFFSYMPHLALKRSMTRHRLGNWRGVRERETWFLANRYMHAIFCSSRCTDAIWGKVFAVSLRVSRGNPVVFCFFFAAFFL